MTASHTAHTIIHCILVSSHTDVVCLISNQLTFPAIEPHMEVVFLSICICFVMHPKLILFA